MSGDGFPYLKLYEMKLTKNTRGWKMEGGVPNTSVVVIIEPAPLYPSCFAGSLCVFATVV